jgi:DHA2 family multidrug resistance protein
MLCMITTNAFALGVIPIQEIKLASGVFSLMRNLGGAFGLAVINTMLTARMDFHTSRLADGINPARPAARDMLDGMAEYLGDLHGGIMDTQAGTLRMIYGLVHREALVLSFGDITLLMAAMFVFVLALVPFVRPLPPLPKPALAAVAKDAH